MRLRFASPRAFVAVFAVLAGAACSDQAPTAPAPGPEHPSFDRINAGAPSRHVIVMHDGSTTLNDVVAAVHALGGKVLRSHQDIGVLTVTGLSDDAAATLANRSDVDGVRHDVTMQMIPPNERISSQRLQIQSDQSGAEFFQAFQWNLRQIKADQAWHTTKQGKGSLVCILDSGIDPDHIDLKGKVDLGISRSFVASEPDIIDHLFHGTFVSALVSSNGLGMASVAPDARLCALKVLDKTGAGSFADLIAAIMYAAKHNADVINMSLGAYFPIQTKSDVQLVVAVQRAINFAVRHRTLPVAAAGNDTVNLATDPPNFVEIPAQLAGVVSVGATAPVHQQNFDRIASYSNVGFPGVDVFAPGGDFVTNSVEQDLILSACASSFCGGENFYLLGAGTSFATPHVSGEGAVIESDFRHDQASNRLAKCIELTSDHPTGRFIDPLYGFGRIDVLTASLCGRI